MGHNAPFTRFLCCLEQQAGTDADVRRRLSWRRPIDGVARKLQGGRDGRRSRKQRKKVEKSQAREVKMGKKKQRQQQRQQTKASKEKKRSIENQHAEETSLETPRKNQKKVRRALGAAWKRLAGGGGGSGRSKSVSRGEMETRMGLLKEIRERVDRHPGDLWRRGKATRHELDDGMLLR